MNKPDDYILWLPSWYPNEFEPYNGDFIQRHAKAASIYNNICVIYIKKDSIGKITKSKKVIVNQTYRLTEIVIYYYSPFFGLIGKIISDWKYRVIYKNIVKKHIIRYGNPKLIHVHVAMKAGIIAKWIKQKYNVPYLITEHWSGLLPISKPSLKDFPFYFQSSYKKVLSDALELSAVSKYLYNSIKEQFYIKYARVISNTVDVSIFKKIEISKNYIPRFIHISSFDDAKNTKSIISAFEKIKSDGCEFYLSMVGPENKNLEEHVVDAGIQKYVKFHREMSQSELSLLINYSDALILYSNYETFGCVVIEANACGVPVIASDIPAMKELINEGFNGIFAKVNNVDSLTASIFYFINNRSLFNKDKIAQHTHNRFNFNKIGKQFDNWYKSVLNTNSYNSIQ